MAERSWATEEQLKPSTAFSRQQQDGCTATIYGVQNAAELKAHHHGVERWGAILPTAALFPAHPLKGVGTEVLKNDLKDVEHGTHYCGDSVTSTCSSHASLMHTSFFGVEIPVWILLGTRTSCKSSVGARVDQLV